MRVRFWGTRGSIAKAGPSTVRYGGNTSCVEVRSSRGTLVVLDCGTGAHGLGHALTMVGGPVNGHILISHTHWDHIQGFPFFTPLQKPGNEWHIYGPRGVGPTLRESLAGQMQYNYFPVTLDQLGATLHYHDLVEGTFDLGDISVTAQYLNHPALTLGYRMEADGVTVVYSTDHEPHSRDLAEGRQAQLSGEDERHARFLEDADLVIHDTQYTAVEYPEKTGWGHSTVESVVDTALAAGVRRLALFHHDPLRDDASVERVLALAQRRVAAADGSLDVFAAREGEVIEVAAAPEGRTAGPADLGPAETEPSALTLAQSVLVAVHDEAVASVLCAAVKADAFALCEARDGDGALEIVKSQRPSLIILDRGLPGRDALEMCSAIRAGEDNYFKEVPIVLVRERGGAAELKRESDAGVIDWLLKPFSLVYARTRIRAWILRTACRWMRAPLPENEERRVRALHGLEILDTGPEERFDRYTRVAAALFDVPVALVSLVDHDRQWFKSRQGMEQSETPRDMAFCAHTILSDDVLQVSDTFQDLRFADNPMVTGGPHIRFYAGVPVSLPDGNRVGTLCLIDHRPRRLNEDEIGLLRDLGKLVERELQSPCPEPVADDEQAAG